jgi:hypothetical protein
MFRVVRKIRIIGHGAKGRVWGKGQGVGLGIKILAFNGVIL